LIFVATIITGCASQAGNEQPEDVVVVPTAAPPEATITEQLSANEQFALFLNGLNTAGLAGNLHDGGPFTVFAPSNTAFGRVQLAPTQFDPDTLQQIMRHHLVSRLLTEEELAAVGNIETLAGASLNVASDGETTMVDYAAIIGEPILAENGIIYPIDAFLLPPETGAEKSMWGVLLADDQFSTLVELMGGTGAMYQLRFSEEPDAFLAPTNQAFTNLPDSLSNLLADLPVVDPHYSDLFAYHILMPNGWPLEKPLAAADIEALDVIQTGVLQGNFAGAYEVDVTLAGDVIQINDAQLLTADIPAANGMVHAIDTVLIPPWLSEAE
jgi:transforming growth factor-beta-induced protein